MNCSVSYIAKIQIKLNCTKLFLKMIFIGPIRPIRPIYPYKPYPPSPNFPLQFSTVWRISWEVKWWNSLRWLPK